MGDLAKYIAEVIEFVVAGVLVLFSLLLLGYVVVRPDLAELPDELPFLSSLGALLPVVGVAFIYALGILAEGMSRIMFEHGLGELTFAKLRAREFGVAVPGAAVKAAHDSEVAHYENQREEFRMYVLAHSPALSAQVEGQLKRLRIERAAALSGGISSLALLIDVAVISGKHDLAVHGVLLVVLVLASCVAARLWLVGEQVPGASELAPEPAARARALQLWLTEVRRNPARAVALTGAVLSAVLLVSIVAAAGSEAVALRAALLVGALVLTACSVALSLVRLKRYLGSIVRCYDALQKSSPFADGSRPAGVAAP
ncbi:hypothetical protein [Nocardioides baculatus]|uniref:Uncharacterized protein n=1 Tax=Nocardioides baculatus TaxID=2801337 RepID=A0ABS1L746_9ACTN|nr:hypothetical protein [Nocardioides baculatus]MBL0746361.1 hypothetical protein [Nocardioides baculatus]